MLPSQRMHALGLISQQPHFSPFLLLYLYVGHFLARWGARMWEFSIGLYMIHIFPDSLLLPAVYGVVESASTALFGPVVGQLVDSLTYVKVLRFWLLAQNLSFIVAGGTVIALLVYADLKSTNFMAFVLLVILTNVSGAVGVLSTLAGTILIERECVSVCLVYWLLTSAYNGIPPLHEMNQKRVSRLPPMPEESPSTHQEKISLLSEAGNDSELSENSWKRKIIGRIFKNSYVSAWRVYFQQDVVLPGVALALIYFTVLSFGTLMTATLEWEGIPAYIIGIARGVSATIGIAATFLYPTFQARISTLRMGLWSIWSQWTCVLVCVASIWVQNNLISAYVLMGGVASSRLGLWMFDLSVIQQMQDQVSESDRIIVGVVQNSLQSFMDLTTYIMGVIVANPQQDSTACTITACGSTSFTLISCFFFSHGF
ncbi:Solute carrier family 40 member like [Actinidia chinensis var. chinensis]|uniref:Solute carrier family 40 member n=1 Tax=Actinidia chinensis var. chinensis TaxID=1590841 RepID=A0A2R6QZ59_ACTCC|nr:Solute carrier family 40 member like [Actinidia chinensis var. chinensis]